MKRYIILCILITSFSAFSSESCVVTRAAFDIGSGATKIKVAKVNTCTQKITEILLDQNLAVTYKQDLTASSDNKLSNEIIQKGSDAINELKMIAKNFNPESYTAVATSAFRTADNGEIAATIISQKTGIDIHIISQEKEAKIGFAAASTLSENSLRDLITWDIGGGSMQITSYEGNNSYSIYKGSMASVPFKNHLITNIQSKDLEYVQTPNPISIDDFNLAAIFANEFATQDIEESIKHKASLDTTEIIGIGGVHYYSLLKAMNKTQGYSLSDLEEHILKNIDKSDTELGGGNYVDTSLSNFILVYGFMKSMNIDYIKVGKLNMADGLLVMPALAQ